MPNGRRTRDLPSHGADMASARRPRTRAQVAAPKAYAMGRNEARLEVALGRRQATWPRLGLIPRLLAHAARRRYSGGLLQAARSLGYVRESAWQPVRH